MMVSKWLKWVFRPVCVVFISLSLVSCGFIFGLFDEGSGDKEDSQEFYTFTMFYFYDGSETISFVKPVFFLFIPLDTNNQFYDESFDESTHAPAFLQAGTVSVDLKRGSYTVLGYVDINGNSGLDPSEFYAFLGRRGFIDSFFGPDSIWVDSFIEEDGYSPYYFQFGDDFELKPLFIISPADGETVNGEAIGPTQHRITVFGLSIVQNVDYVTAYVDDMWVSGNALVDEDNSFVSQINLFGYSTGSHKLEIRGYIGTMPSGEPSAPVQASHNITINYFSPS
jgi:hypothetical protein